MWGNRLGWILAIMVLAIEITFVWLIARQDQVSAPTDFARNPDYIGVMDFPVPPTMVVPSMTRTDDTGATCREAMNEVLANIDTYRDFLTSDRASDAPKLRAIYLLRDAASSTRANLFASTPEAVINYEPDKPKLDALVLAGRCAVKAGQISKGTEAMRHLEAAFSLGWKLYQERLSNKEMQEGYSLMGQASVQLERLAQNDPARAKELREFNKTRVRFDETRIQPVHRVMLSVDPNVIKSSVGDYFYFARNAKDRVWRIEAVLALGRLQYYVGENGRAANQTGARKELSALLDDPDPLVRCAAKAARDLTIEQYRSIR